MKLLNLKERSLLDKLFLNKSEFDKVEELVDVEIIERRDVERDRALGYRCAEYALGNRMDSLLSRGFLNNNGTFEEVEVPQKGDIVVYLGEYFGSNEGWFHVGIYDGEKVVSKWGYGHVFRHELNLVPTTYGDEVRFFRDKGETNINDL